MEKTVKAWAVINEEDICFYTEESDSPNAIFPIDFDGKVSATVLSREIEHGTKVVPCTITYQVPKESNT